MENKEEKKKKEYEKPSLTRIRLDPSSPILGFNCKVSGADFNPALPADCGEFTTPCDTIGS